LVEEIGRVEAPGRPILYGTTPEFMQQFGLSNMAQLQPLNLPHQ
jgi:segregation and condensation protein B